MKAGSFFRTVRVLLDYIFGDLLMLFVHIPAPAVVLEQTAVAEHAFLFRHVEADSLKLRIVCRGVEQAVNIDALAVQLKGLLTGLGAVPGKGD
jgi:hypothetical protein